MTSLLKHEWGRSAAVDRVWAQVTGLRPSQAPGRILAVFQAFIDESEGETGVFVLAGHIATAEAWAKFSKEWEELLPYAYLQKDGTRIFKMEEMLRGGARQEDASWFFRVIEKHVALSLSCMIKREDVKKAKARTWVPGFWIDWDYVNNQYKLVFRVLMDSFHDRRDLMEEVIPVDQQVDFIFDERKEKRAILEMWDEYIEKRTPEMRVRYGATPRFESDNVFLPLQAADLWAGLVRKMYENHDNPEAYFKDADFGFWKGVRKDHAKVTITHDEDTLVIAFKTIIHETLGRPCFICDFADPNWFVPQWPLGTILADMPLGARHGLS